MNKLLKYPLAFVMVISLASCSKEVYQISWQAKPVIADGDPSEWSLPLRYSDPKSGLQYNITNDGTNLYVCIRATERPAQMKIINSGMTIWIDPTGKNKEVAGVHFPLAGMRDRKAQSEDLQSQRNLSEKPEKLSLEKAYELQKPEITLTGFKPGYNGTFETSNSKAVKAAIGWDAQENMSCEMIIPLNIFSAENAKAIRNNSTLGFMIDIPAMNRPQGGGDHARAMQGGEEGGQHHGGMGGGMGGGYSGGHAGSHGGGGNYQRSSANPAFAAMSEPTSIKFKVKLNGDPQ